MPRVIYNAPNADPKMDGLEWTLDRGELISPELTEAQVARYLTIPGFRQVEPPKPAEPAPVQAAEPVTQAEPDPAAEPPAPPAPPKQDEAPPPPPVDPAPAAPPADGPKPRGKPKPATDAGAAGEQQKE